MAKESLSTGVVCSVKYCKNYSINFSSNKLGSVSFWRFPKERIRCSEWILKCQRNDLQNVFEKFGPAQLNEHHFVCSDHFAESDYVDSYNLNRGLNEHAIPSLSLDPNVQDPEPGEILNARKRPHQNNSITSNEKKSENLQDDSCVDVGIDTVNSVDPLRSVVIPPKVVSVDTYFSNRYGKAGTKCAVFDCDNYICQQNAPSYYRFPRDLKRCQVWLTILNQPHLIEKFKLLGPTYCYKNFRVCSDHFKKEDFKNPKMKSQGIFRDAKPSLKLGRKEEDKQKKGTCGLKESFADNNVTCENISVLSSPTSNEEEFPKPPSNYEENTGTFTKKSENKLGLNVKDENLSRLRGDQTQEKIPPAYSKKENSPEFHDIVELSKANKKLIVKLRDLEVHSKVMSKKVIKYQRQISGLKTRNATLREENRLLKNALKPQAPIVLKAQQPPVGTIPRYIVQVGTIPVSQAKVVKSRAQPTPIDEVQTQDNANQIKHWLTERSVK